MTRKRVGGLAFTASFGLFCTALALTLPSGVGVDGTALTTLWLVIAVCIAVGLLSFDRFWNLLRDIATAPRRLAEELPSAPTRGPRRPDPQIDPPSIQAPCETGIDLADLDRRVRQHDEALARLGQKP
ncbi:MAG: hypothetical protein M3340_01610 [Actinomycetota bacterium]|nr:hypothetical protein [Actinomycetota bacterium]